jgi:hypothetical protein
MQMLFMCAAAAAAELQGLTKAVGVSNFNQDRVRNAAKVLKAGGTCLSSNQVRAAAAAAAAGPDGPDGPCPAAELPTCSFLDPLV